MIVKRKETRAKSSDPRIEAGDDAERTMAHYLEREFGHDPSVLVFNDLRLELGGPSNDAVQIDHLVVHCHGMVIVESKSVVEEVSYNQRGEWTRQSRKRNEGMPSPVEQARRQGEALRQILIAHKAKLRDKSLFGMIQGGFRYCPIRLYVAISDRGRIVRKGTVENAEILKADQVAPAIRAMIEHERKAGSLLAAMTLRNDPNAGNYVLNDSEMERIASFLLLSHRPLAGRTPQPAPSSPPGPVRERRQSPAPSPALYPPIRCRHCGGTSVKEVRWGSRAYYAVCASPACGRGTDLDTTCRGCDARARIRKSGPKFHRVCEACNRTDLVWQNPA